MTSGLSLVLNSFNRKLLVCLGFAKLILHYPFPTFTWIFLGLCEDVCGIHTSATRRVLNNLSPFLEITGSNSLTVRELGGRPLIQRSTGLDTGRIKWPHACCWTWGDKEACLVVQSSRMLTSMCSPSERTVAPNHWRDLNSIPRELLRSSVGELHVHYYHTVHFHNFERPPRPFSPCKCV